jgi:hypothetical protein
MSLMLLFKPHPRRGGKGQQLVILPSGKPVSVTEEETTVEQIEELPTSVAPRVIKSFKDLAQISSIKRQLPQKTREVVEMFEQGAAEGIDLEDMVLLFMMTED